MPDQIYIGNFAKGLDTRKLPFNIDNDSFPTLYNMYSWRGRVKRKRGTQTLARFQLNSGTFSVGNFPAAAVPPPFVIISFSGNLYSIKGIVPPTGAAIAVRSVFLTSVGYTFNDFNADGKLITTATSGVGYNGVITAITPGATTTISIAAANSLVAGDQVYISGVNGSLGMELNNQYHTVLSSTAGSFVISTPTTNSYTGGGRSQYVAGSVNYLTGDFTLNVNSGFRTQAITGSFGYYPSLPVMGLEDFIADLDSVKFPIPIGFDTTYAYQLNQSLTPVQWYQVDYYKASQVQFIWNGGDYQQFWSTNYSGAFWATNNVPGLNLVNASVAAPITNTVITFHFTYPSYSNKTGQDFPNLVVGDVVWFNEWSGTSTLNNKTGVVTNAAGAAAGNYVITFSSAVTADGTGIAQLLTNTINTTLNFQDGIKWYDGDPTGGTGIADPTKKQFGWVNFSPPLTALTVSIDNTPQAKYYLAGALAILPFKDHLLFFSPWIQTSSNVAIQLKDTVLWSWNGTPYYTVDASGNPSNIPTGETADVRAYYVDQTGFGGYLPAGIPQPIQTVSNNEDCLIIGFGGDGRKTRFVYTGDDLQPFLFFNINSELPSQSTFSAVALDRGVLDIGQYGIAMTDQQSSARVDLDIPDEVFKIKNANFGSERVNAIRDFAKDWVYFSYPVNASKWNFPTQTFLFNYRDNTWAILYENYTKHGNFRNQRTRTWRTIGFPTWAAWREPWNAGTSSQLVTQIIAGNPQGYVLIIGQGTGEVPSGYISAIANNNGSSQITSYNHCVALGDYLYFTDAVFTPFAITGITLGTTTVITVTNTFVNGSNVVISGVVGTTQLNGNIYKIISVTPTTITIAIDSTLFTPYVSGGGVTSAFNAIVGQVKTIIDKDNFVLDIQFPQNTYLGAGQFTRLSVPLMQTKQFPFYWEQGRKVRLCAQKYLMDYTSNGQVTVQIYLSQDPTTAWNAGSIVPSIFPNPINSTLIYSQLMYTCPESTNIGLTPANTNLQMPTASSQRQIWHRYNTSLIGDSVQIGITLSDAQMRNYINATNEVTLHGMQLTVEPGPLLA